MDVQSTVLFVTTVIAVLWAGYEFITKRRAANADLTTAATELVEEVRGFYRERIAVLEAEQKLLVERVTRLEAMLTQYGCQVMDCVMRQPFQSRSKKS
jgi:Tfp pilus assembly protein PilO